jgi:hypothetical protein
VSDILDIRKRLEERQITRDGLLAEQQDALLNPKYSRALYAMTLALAAYVGLEGEEFAGLLERARTAGSIDAAATDALAELRENLTMSRVTTIITGPDGSVTRIVTRRSGCGCLTF